VSGDQGKAILIVQGPRAALTDLQSDIVADFAVSRSAVVRPSDEGAPLRLYERAEEVLDASFSRVPPESFVRPSRGPSQAEYDQARADILEAVRQPTRLSMGYVRALQRSTVMGYRMKVRWVWLEEGRRPRAPKSGGPGKWIWEVVHAETCDDRGPRIGEDGTRCRKHPRHVQRGDRTHSTALADGHGDVTWSA